MTDYPAEQRLGPDLEMTATYQPAVYDAPKTGQGSWCQITAHGAVLGLLWTSGQGGLGFVPTTDAGRARVPEFYQAFSRAAAAGTPAADVFADWAGRASQGLAAGPVETGDLDTLPD